MRYILFFLIVLLFAVKAEAQFGKFFKESTLEEQTFVKDGKITVAAYLKTVDPEVKVTGFFRYSLND